MSVIIERIYNAAAGQRLVHCTECGWQTATIEQLATQIAHEHEQVCAGSPAARLR